MTKRAKTKRADLKRANDRKSDKNRAKTLICFAQCSDLVFKVSENI